MDDLSFTDFPLSLKETFDQSDVVHFSPNPSSGIVKLNPGLDNPDKIEITDSQGNMAYQQSNIPLKEINLTHLQKGLYYLHIASAGHTYVQKLILN